MKDSIYKIPLFALNYGVEEEQAVLEVLNSKWISSGPKCQELENLFCQLFNSKYALAVTNCTSALHMSLVALGVGQGDEVIVPSLTFVATANAIKYVGATPVFCDIASYENLTIDPERIRKLITPRTRAIIVMHYAGFPCDMSAINEIARENNLRIIEDACHAPLSDYGSRKLGTLGDFGCFSFFSNKNISTGEGGLLLTQDIDLYEKTKLLRSHGMTSLSYERSTGHQTTYDVVDLGFNYRLDDIRASLGIVQLNKLSSDLNKRKTLREYYIDKLVKIDGLIIPFCEYHDFVSNYIFPIVLKDSNHQKRDRLRELLRSRGIQTSVHYPAVHRFELYNDKTTCLEITEYVSDCEITLPFYSSLTKEKIDYIVTTLNEFITVNEVPCAV